MALGGRFLINLFRQKGFTAGVVKRGADDKKGMEFIKIVMLICIVILIIFVLSSVFNIVKILK